MSAYYPMFVDVRGRRCVVIGGGNIGEEKASKLLEAGATVTVISPAATAALRTLADSGKVSWLQRGYQPGDLEGAFVAIAATDDSRVHRQIAQEARENHVLLNVVDVTHLCSFIAPALVQRGDVTIAISTGGASPALARKFREELAQSQLLKYADLAPLLAEVRADLKRRKIKVEPDLWQRCINQDLLEMVQEGQLEEARKTLTAGLLAGQHQPLPTGRLP